MSKKKKREKEGKAVARVVLQTGVVSRFVNGAKEGAPERGALDRLRHEWNALSDKHAMVKATVTFCGQGCGCLAVSFSASGRYADSIIAGTPKAPVPLEELQLTELSIRRAAADFSNSGSMY